MALPRTPRHACVPQLGDSWRMIFRTCPTKIRILLPKNEDGSILGSLLGPDSCWKLLYMTYMPGGAKPNWQSTDHAEAYDFLLLLNGE